MNRMLAVTMMFSGFVVLGGCGGGGGNGGGTGGVSVQHLVNFQVVDPVTAPVSAVDVILDNGTTASATTDATGAVSVDLTGVRTVHFKKANYRMWSYVGRDWTNVNSTQRVAMTPVATTYDTGTYSGAITGTVSTDSGFHLQARRSDGWGTSSSTANLFADGTTNYSGQSSFQGLNDIWLVPSDVSVTASASFAGYRSLTTSAAPVTNATIALTRGDITPGRSFSVSVTGGIVGGNISANYALLRGPFNAAQMIVRNSTSVAATTLSNATVTVPPAHVVFPNVYYWLGAGSSSGNQSRSACWIYHSLAELTAASSSLSLALPSYGISVVGPSNGATSTGTSPTFSWNRAGVAPAYFELVLYRYQTTATGGGYVRPVWIARVYGGATSATLPAALGTLDADTAYSYIIYGRTDNTDGNGLHRCYSRDGIQNIRFSTGTTGPL